MRLKSYVVIPALLVAIGLSYALIQMTRSTPQMELPPTDYADNTGWAALPQPAPDQVWRNGWAMDVILIGPGQNLSARSSKDLIKKTAKGIDQANTLTANLTDFGPVYAPFYRADAEVEDLARALDTYFNYHNQGRAFMIATDHTLPASALANLTNDPSLKERFGGFLTLTKADAIAANDKASLCPTVVPCIQPLATARNDGFLIALDEQAEPLTGAFLDHLKANVAPLAEPLGALEEIEIIEIRRPGDDVVDDSSPQD